MATATRNQRGRQWERALALALVWVPALLVAVHVGSAESPLDSLGEAIRAQRELVSLAPTDPAGHKDLGNLLALRGDLSEAEESYRKALALDPQDSGALYNLALLIQDERPREALRSLRQAVEIEPRSAWAHYAIGVLHQGAGRRQEGIRFFARAFALDPSIALPDVNPQVISNPDLTAALLRAHPSGGSHSAVPRNYSAPGRIASLLIEAPERSDALEEVASEAPTDDAERASGALSVTPPTLNEREGLLPSIPNASSPPSIIGRESRSSNPLPAGTRAEGDSASSQGRVVGADALRGLRDVNQTTPAADPPRGSTRPGARQQQPGARRTAPPGSPARFRPGRRSSARLDVHVVPSTRPTTLERAAAL